MINSLDYTHVSVACMYSGLQVGWSFTICPCVLESTTKPQTRHMLRGSYHKTIRAKDYLGGYIVL